MAGLKIAFLIIAAFLLTTQVESKPVKDILVVKILKKIINEVQNMVNQILADAEIIVDNLDDDYIGIQNKLVSLTRNAATYSIDKVNNVLNVISDQSNTDGQQLIGCITSEESDVADIPANFVKGLSTCVEDEISNLFSDLTPLVKDLTRTANKTSTIVADLVYCDGNGVFDLLCVAQALDDITAAIVNDIPDMVSDVAPILNDLPDVRETVVKYWKRSVLDVSVQIGQVVDSIASCNKS